MGAMATVRELEAMKGREYSGRSKSDGVSGDRVMDLMMVRDRGEFGENRVDADRVIEVKMMEVMGTMTEP